VPPATRPPRTQRKGWQNVDRHPVQRPALAPNRCALAAFTRSLHSKVQTPPKHSSPEPAKHPRSASHGSHCCPPPGPGSGAPSNRRPAPQQPAREHQKRDQLGHAESDASRSERFQWGIETRFRALPNRLSQFWLDHFSAKKITRDLAKIRVVLKNGVVLRVSYAHNRRVVCRRTKTEPGASTW